MSEAFALKQKFRIRNRSKDMRQFELGSGKKVWSTGRVSVPVELHGTPHSRRKCWFYVLPNCPVDLILGMPFLKEAEILTKNRHLLENCRTDWNSISSLLWIGSPRNRMKFGLDGHDLVAVVDTGSDLNLISLKAAKREGFHIDRRREARTRIRVGDGTEAETIGQIYVQNLSLDWGKEETKLPGADGPTATPAILTSDPTFDESTPSTEADTDPESQGVVFHVLPGLSCDVIFGRELLEYTDAFNLCPDLLDNQCADEDNPLELNVLISLGSVSFSIPISRRNVPIADPKEQHDKERHAELYRRSQREDEIALLPPGEQDRAKIAERRKARAWDALHVTCIHCNPV